MAAIAATATTHPQVETPDYPASIAGLATVQAVAVTPAVVLTADQPFDYLGIGDATTYWTQWLQAAAGSVPARQAHQGHALRPLHRRRESGRGRPADLRTAEADQGLLMAVSRAGRPAR